MRSLVSILEPSLRDLVETISDFRDASFQSSDSVLQRFVHQLDEEPLAGTKNLRYCRAFFRFYCDPAIGQQAVAKLGDSHFTWLRLPHDECESQWANRND